MLRTLWQKNKLAVIVFSVACLVALFFAVRLAFFTVYWSDPARRDAVIEGWQSPGYVAMSWKVPRPIVAEALGLAEGDQPRRSLDDIAAERGLSTEVLIRDLEAAIAEFRAGTE
jgi:hypothetical protein